MENVGRLKVTFHMKGLVLAHVSSLCNLTLCGSIIVGTEVMKQKEAGVARRESV